MANSRPEARRDEGDGTWLEREDGRKVLITLHPSALLRVPPEDRDEAFAAFAADLKKARKVPKP